MDYGWKHDGWANKSFNRCVSPHGCCTTGRAGRRPCLRPNATPPGALGRASPWTLPAEHGHRLGWHCRQSPPRPMWQRVGGCFVCNEGGAKLLARMRATAPPDSHIGVLLTGAPAISLCMCATSSLSVVKALRSSSVSGLAFAGGRSSRCHSEFELPSWRANSTARKRWAN